MKKALAVLLAMVLVLTGIPFSSVVSVADGEGTHTFVFSQTGDVYCGDEMSITYFEDGYTTYKEVEYAVQPGNSSPLNHVFSGSTDSQGVILDTIYLSGGEEQTYTGYIRPAGEEDWTTKTFSVHHMFRGGMCACGAIDPNYVYPNDLTGFWADREEAVSNEPIRFDVTFENEENVFCNSRIFVYGPEGNFVTEFSLSRYDEYTLSGFFAFRPEDQYEAGTYEFRVQEVYTICYPDEGPTYHELWADPSVLPAVSVYYGGYLGEEATIEMTALPGSGTLHCGDMVGVCVTVNGTPVEGLPVRGKWVGVCESGAAYYSPEDIMTDADGIAYFTVRRTDEGEAGHYELRLSIDVLNHEETINFAPGIEHDFQYGTCRGCGMDDPDYVFPYSIASFTADKSVVDSCDPIRLTLALDDPVDDQFDSRILVVDSEYRYMADVYLHWRDSGTVVGTYSFDPENQWAGGTYHFVVDRVYREMNDENGCYQLQLADPALAQDISITYNGCESIADVQISIDPIPEPFYCGDTIGATVTANGDPIADEQIQFNVQYRISDDSRFILEENPVTDSEGHAGVEMVFDPNLTGGTYYVTVTDWTIGTNVTQAIPAIAHRYESGCCPFCGAADPDFDDYPYEITSFTANKSVADSNDPILFELSLNGEPENWFRVIINVLNANAEQVDSFEIYPGGNHSKASGTYTFDPDRQWSPGTYTFLVSQGYMDYWDDNLQRQVRKTLADPSGAVLTVDYNGYESLATTEISINPLPSPLHCGDEISATFTVNGAPVSGVNVSIEIFYIENGSRVGFSSGGGDTDENGQARQTFRMCNGRDDLQYGVVACVNGMSGVETEMMLPQPVHRFEGGTCRGCGQDDPDYAFPYSIASFTADKSVVDSCDPIRFTLALDDPVDDQFTARVITRNPENSFVDSFYLYWTDSGTVSGTYSFDPENRWTAGTYTFEVSEVYLWVYDENGGHNVQFADPSLAAAIPITYNGYESVVDVQVSIDPIPEPFYCGDEIGATIMANGVPMADTEMLFDLSYRIGSDSWFIMDRNVVTDSEGRAYAELVFDPDYSGGFYELRVTNTATGINVTQTIPEIAHYYENGVCTFCGAFDPDFDDYPYEITSFTANKSVADSNDPISFELSLSGESEHWFRVIIDVLNGNAEQVDSFEISPNGDYAEASGSYTFDPGRRWAAGTYSFVVRKAYVDYWDSDLQTDVRLPLADASYAPVLTVDYNGYQSVAVPAIQIDTLPSPLRCNDEISATFTVNGTPVSGVNVSIEIFYIENGSRVGFSSGGGDTDENGQARQTFRMFDGRDDLQYGVVACVNGISGVETEMMLPQPVHQFEDGRCRGCDALDPDFVFPYTVTSLSTDKTVVDSLEPFRIELQLDHALTLHEHESVGANVVIYDETDNWIDNCWLTWDGSRTFSTTYSFDPDRQLPAGTYTIQVEEIYQDFSDKETGGYRRILLVRASDAPTATIDYNGYESVLDVQFAPVSLPETLHCFDQICVALTADGVPVSGVSASFTLYYSDDENHWVNGSWVETDENGRMYISIYPWQNHMDDHYRLNVNCDAFHINEWYDLPALAHSYENGVCTGCGAIDPDFDDYPFEITSFTMNKTSVDSNEPVNFTLSLDGMPLDENGLAYWHAAIHVKDPDGNEIDSFELNDRNGNQVTGSYLFPKTNFWEAGTYTFTVNSVTRNDNWPEIPLAKPSDAPVLSIQYNGYDHVAEALLQFDPLGEEIHCGDSIHARLTVNGEPVKDKYVEFTVYYTGGSSSVLVDASASNTNANGYATIPFRIYENHEDDAYVVYAREYTMNLYANMTLPTASHAFENGFCTYCGEIGPDYEYPYEVQYFTIDKTTVATNELIAAEVKLKNCSKWIEVRMALLDEAGNTIDEYYSYGDGRSMKTFSITTGYGLPAGTYTLELRSVMMDVYDETLKEYHRVPAADPGSVPSLTITYLGPDSSVEYAMYLTSPNPDGSIRCGDEVTAVVTSDGASVANADVQFTFGVNGESYERRNVTTDANGLARTTFSLSDDAGSYYVLARLQDTDVSASIYFSAASHDYESGVCMNCDRYDPDFDDYPFEVSSFSLRHTELKDREILPLDFVLTKLKNESYSNLWINAYITTNGYSRDLYLMIDDTTGRVTADFLLNSEEMPAGTYYLFLNGISMNKYVNGRYMSLRAADLNDISPLAFTFLGEGAAVSYSASIVSEEPLVCGTWAEVQILADGAPLAYAPVYVDSYCGEERITWNSLVVTDENGIARAFIRADWEDSAGASDYSLRISIADETIGTIPCAIAHDFHEGICSCGSLDPDYHDHPFTVTGFSLNRTAIAFGEPLTAEIRLQGDKAFNYMSAMFMIRDSEGIKSELWANCDVLNRICLTVPTSTIAQLTPGTYSLSVEQITYEYTDDATGEYRRAAAADVSGLAPIEFTYLGEEGTHFELHLNVETDDRVADCGEELTATLTSNGMPVSNAELEIWFLITDGNQENNYCYRSFFRTTDGDGRVTFPMELEDRRYMLEEGQKIAVWASFGTLIAKLEFDDFAHDGTDVCAQCGYPVHEVETRVYTVDLLEIDKETVYQGDVVTAHIKISSPNGDPVSDLRLNVYGNNEYYYLSSGAQYLDENGEVTVKIPVTCNYEEGYNVFTVIVSLYDYKYPATIRSCPEVTFTQLEGEIVLPTLHGTLTLTPDVIGEGEPITYTAVVLDESNVPYENAIVRFETWFGSRSIGASNVPTNEEGIAEMSIRLYEDGWAPYGEYTIKAVVNGTVIDTKTVMFTGYTNGVSVDEAGLVDVPETMYDDSEEGFLVIDASFLPDKAEGVRFTRAELSAILTSIRTSGKRLGIRLSDAAIALDDAAVEELLSAPGNDDIEIRCYRIPVYELNAAEQADLSDSLRYVPMHLSTRTGSEAITGLSEGTMEVFLPFLPEESTDICTLRLFGRSSEGLTERTEKLTFADDLLRFTTDLFADFVFSVNWNLLYADTDSDDLVTVDDAAYLLYSLYFPDAYPRNQSFDFNGDNVEDEQDALYLLYALVFPDLYPLRKE